MYLKKDEEKHNRKVNKTRALVGLDLLELKKRECLKCEDEFLSESSNNRVCFHCKVSMRNYYND